MTKRGNDAPGGDRPGDRRERLSAELRRNLVRRKEQSRAVRGGGPDLRAEGLPAACVHPTGHADAPLAPEDDGSGR